MPQPPSPGNQRPPRRPILHPAAVACALALLLPVAPPAAAEGDAGRELRAAATAGDLPKVVALLDAGTDVDAASEYGATALAFAADKGHTEIVKLLLDRGAQVNAKDTFYDSTPLTWATYNGHGEVVRLLLSHGAEGAGQALSMAIGRDQPEAVKAIAAAGELTPQQLGEARAMAASIGKQELAALLDQAGAVEPQPGVELPAELLRRYVGNFRAEDGMSLVLAYSEEAGLTGSVMGQPPVPLLAETETTFSPAGIADSKLIIELDGQAVDGQAVDGQAVIGIRIEQGGRTIAFTPATDTPEPGAPEAEQEDGAAGDDPGSDDSASHDERGV